MSEMTAEHWMATIFEGSAAALISLLGLFAVFYLTRRHDDRRDARRADVERIQRRDERTRSNVSSVIDRAHRVRAYTQLHEAAARDLAHSLTMFSVQEGGDYPEAAAWAYQKSGDVLDALGIGQDPRALIWECGYITSALSNWLSSGCPDTLHPRPEKPEPAPRQKDEELMRLVKRILRDRGLAPTFENIDLIRDELQLPIQGTGDDVANRREQRREGDAAQHGAAPPDGDAGAVERQA